MFRQMRMQNRKLKSEEAAEILKSSTSGVLALDGDDDYPYAVPLSFVYEDDKIYFHCASAGHKIDAIKKNSKASFCVVSKDNVIPEKLTSKYESVIVFGRIHIVENEDEKMLAIKHLSKKYAPNVEAEEHIEKYWKALSILKLQIEHLSGKKSK